MKRKAKLVEIRSDHTVLNQNRPLVRGWRLRRYETVGLKDWARYAAPQPRSCGVRIEYMPQRPGAKLPAHAVRALMAMVNAPHVLVVPPGTPRRGGLMGKTFPCAGIFRWDQPGLAEVLAEWWGEKGHVIFVVPEGEKAPGWLESMMGERVKLRAYLTELNGERWVLDVAKKKSAPLKSSRGARAQGARGAVRLGEKRCA